MNMDIIKKNGKSPIYSNITKIFTGTAIGQGLSVLFLPIATRLYGAEYYGDLALFVAMSSIILSFLGFGLSSAIMTADSDEEAIGIYKISVYGTGLILFFVMCVLYLLSPYFQIYSINIDYKSSLVLLAVSIFIANMINMTYSWLNRKGRFKILALNPIITPLSNNVILIILAILGFHNIGLFLGYFFSQLITLLHMQKHKGIMKTQINYSIIKNILSKNKDFLFYQYPSSIAVGVGNQIPIFLLSIFFGSKVVGYYSLALRLLNIPISLIGGSITRVYFKEAMDIQRKNESARRFTFKFAEIIFRFYFIPAILIISFGDILVPLVLGKSWSEVGIYIQVLMLWNMFYLIVNAFGGFPSVISMQKRNLKNSIMNIILNIISLVVSYILFEDPFISLLFFAMGNIINHIWFYNDMFSSDPLLKNKYLKLSLLYFCVVVICSLSLSFIFEFIILNQFFSS